MSNKYFSGHKGPYIYCEMCGQATYVWDVTKLIPETGRGGLLVCKNDADALDFGLVPYKATEERQVPLSRPNHTNTTNGSEPRDVEANGVY